MRPVAEAIEDGSELAVLARGGVLPGALHVRRPEGPLARAHLAEIMPEAKRGRMAKRVMVLRTYSSSEETSNKCRSAGDGTKERVSMVRTAYVNVVHVR